MEHQTRLHDSVRSSSPQVQGHPVHFSQGRRCPCLACGNRSPAGEGCDRAGPSSGYGVGFFSPYFIVPMKSGGSFEPCTSQAAVQDVDAENAFSGASVP